MGGAGLSDSLGRISSFSQLQKLSPELASQLFPSSPLLLLRSGNPILNVESSWKKGDRQFEPGELFRLM